MKAPPGGGIAKRSLIETILFAIRDGIRHLVYTLFGYDMAGRMAADFTSSATSEIEEKVEDQAGWSKAERRDAIFRAFGDVRNEFMWDAERGQWVARSAE